MKTEKLFQLSCPVFWGFNRIIDISRTSTVQECIDIFLEVHREFLFEQNYIDLLNFFDAHKSEYHIHNMTFENIMNSNETIYVCRHNTHSSDNKTNNSELENNLNKETYKNPNPNLF